MLRVLRRFSSKRAPLIAALAAFVLSLPSLGLGFFLDDWYHQLYLRGFPIPGGPRGSWDLYRFADGSDAMRGQIQHGPFPWWTSPDLRLSFFRPIPSLLRAAEDAIFGDTAWPSHLLSSLCLAALAYVAAVTYRRLLVGGATGADGDTGAAGSVAAGFAAFAFAIDDAHNLNVSWPSARYSLIASTFALLGFLAHARARKGDGPAWLSPLCFALGLLSGETSLGLLGYLVAYAWFLDPTGRLRGAKALAPHGLVLVAWAIPYKLAGYGADHSLFYIDPVRRPGVFLLAVADRLPKLGASLLFGPPGEVFGALPPSTSTTQAVVAFVLAGVVVAGVLRYARSPVSSALLLGAMLAAIPQCATNPDDRLLLLPGFGAFGALGLLIERAATAVARGRLERWLTGALIVTHLGLAPLLFPLRQIAFPSLICGIVQRGSASFPTDAAIEGQDLILIGTPDQLFTVYMFLDRQKTALPKPRFVRVLTVQTQGTLTLTRVEEDTLDVDNETGQNGGPFWGLYRDTPYRTGDVIELEEMTAAVREAKDGVPTKLRFTLAGPFSEKRFMIWQGRGFVEIELPPKGASARYEVTPLDQAMR